MWNVSWRHIESLKVECLTCLIVVHATEEAHWTDPLEVWSFCTFFPLTSSNEPVCQHFRVSTSDQLRSFFFRSAVWTLQLESIPKGSQRHIFRRGHESRSPWCQRNRCDEMNECWVHCRIIYIHIYIHIHIDIYIHLSWVHPARIRFCQLQHQPTKKKRKRKRPFSAHRLVQVDPYNLKSQIMFNFGLNWRFDYKTKIWLHDSQMTSYNLHCCGNTENIGASPWIRCGEKMVESLAHDCGLALEPSSAAGVQALQQLRPATSWLRKLSNAE